MSAVQGDARALPAADRAYDVVLPLGPLYHLLDRGDRVRALAEARRVVRPGGLVVAATINRLAGVHDMTRRGRFAEAVARGSVTSAARTGVLSPPPDSGFTTAYLHHPGDVPVEFADAGLPDAGQYAVEAPCGCSATWRRAWTTRRGGPGCLTRCGSASPTRRCWERARIC